MGDAANPRFSVAERNFLTEKKCAWVAGAASRGRRKEELVESNASVALKRAMTETKGRKGGMLLSKWQGRKSLVSGRCMRFP